MPKRPLIIDCDPGEDDAAAILVMAGNPNFEIKGITPVCGNKELAFCQKNALMLCELIGQTDIPVARGADKPMMRDPRTAGSIHGATGLGTVVLPEPKKTLADISAWDLIYGEAKKAGGELEILAIGPLTNLGIAFTKYPELKSGMIKQISIMGGASGAGKMSSTAEFNVWADPEAAKIVCESGVKIAMFGLDICFKAHVTPDDLVRIRGNGAKIHSVFAELLAGRVNFCIKNGMQGGILCDAVAAAYLINPELFTLEHCYINVETKGALTLGKTVVDWAHSFSCYPPTASWGMEIDREKFIDLIVASLDTLEPPRP